MSPFNERLRQLLRWIPLGRRGSTAKRAARQLLKGFNRFGIDLVFDVGANTGQFAEQIRSSGYKGHIVSFEPLSEAHRKLCDTASSDAVWIVHERCALGDQNAAAEVYIAGNSVSSSLLRMTQTHCAAAPGSAYVGSEPVKQTTLDAVAHLYLNRGHRRFLKIDTQGYEWQVLLGAKDTLPKVQGVLCELSLVVLYEGQHLWREMIDYLEGAGFTLWGLQPSFMDQHGRNLQVDAIFFRQDDFEDRAKLVAMS